jgi:hypothetical protein
MARDQILMSARIALTALETDFGVRPLKRRHRGA